jgi:hypothetical protein
MVIRPPLAAPDVENGIRNASFEALIHRVTRSIVSA